MSRAPGGSRSGRRSTPTVHVEDADEAYERAIAAGAEAINPPTTIMEGVRTAMVRAKEGC